MAFKVQKNIPIPDKPAPKKNSKYPWDEMSVGDSFFVTCGDGKTMKSIRDVVKQSSRLRARYHEEYTVMQVVEDGVEGVRVWRIK